MPGNIDELTEKIIQLEEKHRQIRAWCEGKLNAIADGMSEALERSRENTKDTNETFLCALKKDNDNLLVALKQHEKLMKDRIEKNLDDNKAYGVETRKRINSKLEAHEGRLALTVLDEKRRMKERIDKRYAETKNNLKALENHLSKVIATTRQSTNDRTDEKHEEVISELAELNSRIGFFEGHE